jgi:hypothetical protein
LVVIGARPSNGKTTLLFNWVNSLYSTIASERHRVLCFWTERSVDLAYWTWACLRAGLPLDLAIKGEWESLPSGAEEHIRTDVRLLQYWDREQASGREGWIQFASQERPTVSQLLGEVEALGPQVLVLDYIQRLKAERRQTRFDAIAEAANALQQLAVQRGMLVVVGSQLKRRGDGVFDKYLPPHLEDFKLSGEIEENADVALGLYRPLRRMTAKEQKAVRFGEMGLDAWKIPNTMAIKTLKHRYWGDAADRIVRVQCRDGQITDEDGFDAPAPLGAGDAWEERPPF